MRPYIKKYVMSVKNSKHFAFAVLVHLVVSDRVFQCLMFYVTSILHFSFKKSIKILQPFPLQGEKTD